MQRTDLTTGDEKHHLIRQTLPMLWGVFAIMSMNLADTFFVGQLGTDELAAMGFTFPVVMIISSLAFGVGTGASSVISRAIGSQDDSLVKSYSTQSIIIAVCIGLLFAGIGLANVDSLFTLLGAAPHLLPLIHDYMDIWYLSCALIVVPMVGNAGIRAAGNAKLPSLVMISVAVVNLILDPILIFGLFGLPRLELQGAALATAIAYSVAFVIGLYVLRVKLQLLSWGGCYHQVWHSWKAILRIAIPAAGTNLITPFSSALTTWMVAHYGTAAVAGYGIAARIEMFSLIVLMALSAILAPFAGQNWGAKKFSRLKRAQNLSFKFSAFWGIAIAIILAISAPWLVSGFNADSATQQAATLYLYYVPITFAFLGVVMMVSSIANGIGQPLPALFMTLGRLLVLYLPLAWLLSHWLDLAGIYLATALSNVLVGLAAWYWSEQKCRVEAEFS